ncbi:hypothetical protein D1007_42030 [Hordeum vulgare]|nr:hypothetical protein D1007_42030 [Hordeum vulgare]
MFPIKYEKTPYFCQVCGLMGHNHEECGDGVWEAKQKQWGSWMLAQRKEVASGKRDEDHAGRGGRSGGRARAGGRGRGGNRGHTSPARKRSSQDAGLDDGQGEEDDVTSPLKAPRPEGEASDNDSGTRRSLNLALSICQHESTRVRTTSSSTHSMGSEKDQSEGGRVMNELPINDDELPMIDAQLTTNTVKLLSFDAQLPISNNQLPAVDVLLPIIDVKLPAICKELS